MLRMLEVNWGIALLAVGIVVGCAGSESVSDTGFVGTWVRVDSNSKISFTKQGSGWLFNWKLKMDDRSVRCDGNGRCDEEFQGEKIYEWRFEAEPDVDGSSIRLSRSGIPVGPNTTPLSEVDRLELRPGGLELYAFTIERNGQLLGAPNGPFRYRKISDRPF